MPAHDRNKDAVDPQTQKLVWDLEWEAASPFGSVQPSRPIRHLPEGGGVVEITTRTIHGRFLLKPGREANDRIAGVIGRALDLHPTVKLFGYWFLSNHYNLLGWFANVDTMRSFMTFVNSNLARELGSLYGWKEKFWGRRYRAILVVDSQSEVKRLAYLLAQGTKEGLVARPREWPGLNCLETLVSGTQIVGRWIDRTGLYNARRRGQPVSEADFVVLCPISLAPLPAWTALTEEERRFRISDLVEAIERKAAEDCSNRGRPPMGAKKILAQDPHAHPTHIARSAAPMCHASSRTSFWRYARSYGGFLAIYRDLSDRLLEGDLTALEEFPKRCFRPAPPPRVRARKKSGRAAAA